MADLAIVSAFGDELPPHNAGDIVLGYGTNDRLVATLTRETVSIRREELCVRDELPVWKVDPEAGITLTYEMLAKIVRTPETP